MVFFSFKKVRVYLKKVSEFNIFTFFYLLIQLFLTTLQCWCGNDVAIYFMILHIIGPHHDRIFIASKFSCRFHGTYFSVEKDIL